MNLNKPKTKHFYPAYSGKIKIKNILKTNSEFRIFI